jgi:hypothetical protein
MWMVKLVKRVCVCVCLCVSVCVCVCRGMWGHVRSVRPSSQTIAQRSGVAPRRHSSHSNKLVRAALLCDRKYAGGEASARLSESQSVVSFLPPLASSALSSFVSSFFASLFVASLFFWSVLALAFALPLALALAFARVAIT